MAQDEEHVVLICRPAYIPARPVPGSLVCRCSRCGQDIIVAPSAWILSHDNPGTEFVCMSCGFKLIKENPGRLEPPTPLQLEEIREVLHEDT